MRLWSIALEYLDTKGLVALWRETLLAQKVLKGETNGYINHPQLERFRNSAPITSIGNYLLTIWEESQRRGYHFNREKIGKTGESLMIPVTTGQIEYEFNFLQSKLLIRDRDRYELNSKEVSIEINPIFTMVTGGIESWERPQL